MNKCVGHKCVRRKCVWYKCVWRKCVWHTPHPPPPPGLTISSSTVTFETDAEFGGPVSFEIYTRYSNFDSSHGRVVSYFNDANIINTHLQLSIYNNGNTGVITTMQQLRLSDGSDNTADYLISDAQFETSTWVHLVVVFENEGDTEGAENCMRIYKNGRATTPAVSCESKSAAFENVARTGYISAWPGFEGTIAVIQRFDQALTAEDAETLYEPFDLPHHAYDFSDCTNGGDVPDLTSDLAAVPSPGTSPDCSTEGAHFPDTAGVNYEIPPWYWGLGLAGTSAASTGYQDCTACPAGTSANATGAAECTNCDTGRYSGTARSTVCKPCDEGSYTQGQGGVSCARCAGGTHLSGVVCVECEEGKYSNPGATECTDCDHTKGWVSMAVGDKNACFYCGLGTYANHTSHSCQTCTAGRYSVGGSDTCIASKGSISEKEGMSSCSSCVPGTVPVNGSTACQSCEAGTFAGFGADVCVGCADGFTSEDGQGFCSACPQYMKSGGSGTCECDDTFVKDGKGGCTCQAGEMLEGTSCAACAFGKFKGEAGIDACSLCDKVVKESTTLDTGAATNGSCVCAAGSYKGGGKESELECIDVEQIGGVEEDVWGMELSTIVLKEGTWRRSTDTRDVRACPVEKACIGGNSSKPNGYCRAGHEGPYCNICEEGFSKDVFKLCQRCSALDKGNAVQLALSFLGVLAGIALLYFLWTRCMAKRLATNPKLLSGVKSGGRILLVMFQVRRAK